jgi:hypothetical protein
MFLIRIAANEIWQTAWKATVCQISVEAIPPASFPSGACFRRRGLRPFRRRPIHRTPPRRQR